MWIFDQDKREDRRDVADLKEMLKTQLAALSERRYELTLRTRDDQVSYAQVGPEDILDRVRDLRAVNRAGTEIALRPAERSGLALLRDVSEARIADLRQDGFPPVLLTEPQVGRYDAWVRLDDVGIQRGLHDSMAQVLAARYGGDPLTAGAEQAAPLAGFALRDDPAQRVALISADREGCVAPAALDLADWVLDRAQLAPTVVAAQHGRWMPADELAQAVEWARAREEAGLTLGARAPTVWTEERPAPWDDPAAWVAAVEAGQPAEPAPAWARGPDGDVDLEALSRLNPGVTSLLRADYSREIAVAQGLDLDALPRAEALAWVRDNLAVIAEEPLWHARGFRSAAEREEGLSALADAFQEAGLPLERGVAVPIGREGASPVDPPPPRPARGDPPAARAPAAGERTYAEEFGTLRRVLLEGGQGRLDARQAEWGAAHQLVAQHPTLTREELRQAIDRGGASGQGQGRTPPERDAYVARTAEKVWASARAPQGQERARTTAPPQGQERPPQVRSTHDR